MLNPYNSEHEEALMVSYYGENTNDLVYCELCQDRHEDLQGVV